MQNTASKTEWYMKEEKFVYLILAFMGDGLVRVFEKQKTQ